VACSDTAPDDTSELTSGGASHSDGESSLPRSSRSAWKARLGYVLWSAVAVFAVFEVASRMWLGWYDFSHWDHQYITAGEIGSWTHWHTDPVAIAAMALAYCGVWWEAGRISQT
jgi:hypothetical protein